MHARELLRKRPWNIERRTALGHRFLRVIQAAGIKEAIGILNDSTAPEHNRCLAARAIGLLSEESIHTLLAIRPEEQSRLGQAWIQASRDWHRRRWAEMDAGAEARARTTMHEHGWLSTSDVIAAWRDGRAETATRVTAAETLSRLDSRQAVPALIEQLDREPFEVAAASALSLGHLRSRSATKPLLRIIRGRGVYAERLRLQAVVAMWALGDKRAEATLIRVAAALEQEDDYTRDRATEALSSSIKRHLSQHAIAERLSDPSPLVRKGAICASGWLGRKPEFLQRALEAALTAPKSND